MVSVIHIGSVADIDPIETNTDSELASLLVGYTASGPNAMQIVDLIPNNDPSSSNSHLIGDNDRGGANAGGDSVSYNLGAGLVTERLDSTIWVTVDINNSGASTTVSLLQTISGELFIAENPQPAFIDAVDNLNIQTIEITGISRSDTTGWIFEALDDSGAAYDISGTQIVCFTRGTRIRTDAGEVEVEKLQPGDLVLTLDAGPQPIRWTGSCQRSAAELTAHPNLRPIRIKAGALGNERPTADLIISPQHRVLVRSKIAMRMFAANEVLVAAKQLLEIDGVEIAEDLAEVEYFHFMFDRHEIVISNGTETESLYSGSEALKTVGADARREILALFPELRNRAAETPSSPARLLVKGRQARQLARRHVRNKRKLVW